MIKRLWILDLTHLSKIIFSQTRLNENYKERIQAPTFISYPYKSTLGINQKISLLRVILEKQTTKHRGKGYFYKNVSYISNNPVR